MRRGTSIRHQRVSLIFSCKLDIFHLSQTLKLGKKLPFSSRTTTSKVKEIVYCYPSLSFLLYLLYCPTLLFYPNLPTQLFHPLLLFSLPIGSSSSPIISTILISHPLSQVFIPFPSIIQNTPSFPSSHFNPAIIILPPTTTIPITPSTLSTIPTTPTIPSIHIIQTTTNFFQRTTKNDPRWFFYFTIIYFKITNFRNPLNDPFIHSFIRKYRY